MSDLISREDALNLCEAIENDLQADIIDAEKNPNAYSSDFIKGMSSRMDGVLDVAIEISSLSSADRPTGEWVSNHDGSWNCSECGLRVFVYAKGNFCPNCGAKMKGENHD